MNTNWKGKLMFVVLLVTVLVAFGMLIYQSAQAAPSAPVDEDDPTLVWKRGCWSGMILVSNPRNQPDQDWTDVMCMSYDLQTINWVEVCGTEDTHYVTTPVTSWGMLQGRCWQRALEP